MRRFIIIFDGPPASGKTTRSRILAQKLRSPYLHYKVLGFVNTLSTIIIRLAPRYSMTRLKHFRTKEDPVLLLDSRLLNKMKLIIFLAEIPYKILQVVLLIALSFICSYLVIDEFLVLRIANYVNVYLHGGLSRWQAELLIRTDLALLKVLAKHGNIRYIYIDRHIEELKNLWYKREFNKEYSETYLILVRLIWKIYQPEISRLTKVKKL
ncbi:MAG: hypothetical protein QXH96_01705 [Candidatus Geothermarchaeota archaeon]